MKSKITLKEETNHMISIDVIIGCYQFHCILVCNETEIKKYFQNDKDNE